jgi:hypothetical protein
MNRKNKKKSAATTPAEHIDAVGELLDQLKTHLTSSAGKVGTYSDYLRLLDFYSQADAMQPRQILVGWVDDPRLLSVEPPA